MNELRPFRRLDAAHNLDDFDCGVAELNERLRQFAISDQSSRASVTYLLNRGTHVVGFYTLAPTAIEPDRAAQRLGAGLPRNRPIPAILRARLALDRSEQWSGLGSELLRDALARCPAAADDIGGRAVLVHGKDEAAGMFYRRWGFADLPDNPQPLYLLMKDLRASIAARSSHAIEPGHDDWLDRPQPNHPALPRAVRTRLLPNCQTVQSHGTSHCRGHLFEL